MTTDRHDPDAMPELSDEFWGDHAEWTPQRTPTGGRRGLGATIGRWWDHLLGSGVDTERAHGEPVVPALVDIDRVPDHGDPADDAGDLDVDGWTVEPAPQPGHRGGDPLLARFGLVAVIVTLASPMVVGFTAAGDDSPPPSAQLVVAGAAEESALDTATTTEGTSEQATESTDSSRSVQPGPSTGETEALTSPTSDEVDITAGTVDAAAAEPTVEQPPEPTPSATANALTAPACGGRYQLAAGDYWIRLADAAGVPLTDLLAVNDATVDTVLVPGRSICLPVGATTPSPPATVPPAPPKKPAPRPVPDTTVAPAPKPPTRPAAFPPSQAVQIIRDVWPDDLEARAVEIAWRESNHRSNVNNSCCYGLFQIHWQAHRSWLSMIGVTSVTQLYDPTANATAAYVLYQRAGGFGPWGG
jgi:hypothetical protein